MITKYAIHLLSGGIDSTVLLYDLIGQGVRVHAVLFDYGQRHVQELEFAKLHCRRMDVMFTTITIQQLRGSVLTDGSGSYVVPNRNAILLSHAVNLAVSAGADTVTFAANKDDAANFPDCRPEFVQAMNAMLKAQQVDVEICAPYISKSKAWIVALGQEIGVRLTDTWSCYAGGATPCGTCDACRKRKEAGQ